MNPVVQAVLAAMVFLVPPGKSPYSVVPVEPCDTQCQQTPLCQPATSLSCRPPRWSPFYDAHMRMETYEEGLKRYWTVAQVVAALSDAMTWEHVDGCRPYGRTDKAECKLLRRARPWGGTPAELRRILVSSMHRESGFRRDIHSGVGPMARGDCRKDQHGRRIPGSCRSHCLGQVLLDKRAANPSGGPCPR